MKHLFLIAFLLYAIHAAAQPPEGPRAAPVNPTGLPDDLIEAFPEIFPVRDHIPNSFDLETTPTMNGEFKEYRAKRQLNERGEIVTEYRMPEDPNAIVAALWTALKRLTARVEELEGSIVVPAPTPTPLPAVRLTERRP